ncbi:MAG: HNH endonuclease [Lachnospiraceae bacterium]|nr:HNH endonuclease [Lachnospiraceae bacterium]
MEIWKDVPEFEGCYQVSNEGRIKSLARYVNVCGGGKRLIPERIIKPTVCKNGYLELQASRNCQKKVFLLHRLVATLFIENPNSLPEVNHKDEDISNCTVENLEWCTSKYNANYGTRNERCATSLSKPIKQYTKEGELVKEWNAIKDASRECNFNDAAIIRCCKGKQKTSYGFIWEYA